MAYDYATDAETSPPPPRRRRRITSSAKFWVAFVIVVLGGIAAAAALVGSGESDTKLGSRVESGGNGDGPGSGPASTTAPLPFEGFHEYEVTDGVNIRSGPATTYQVLGTVETGHKVFVVCWVEGETIDGPSGPTNKWVKVLFGSTVGYITDQYVDTRADINNPQLIALCETL